MIIIGSIHRELSNLRAYQYRERERERDGERRSSVCMLKIKV